MTAAEQRRTGTRIANMNLHPPDHVTAIAPADKPPSPSTKDGSSKAINDAKCASWPSCGVAVSSSNPSERRASTSARRLR